MMQREAGNEVLVMNESQQKRLSIWERNLLDLSMRNTFLNFRGNKKAVWLQTASLDALQEALEKEVFFSFQSLPEGWTVSVNEEHQYVLEQSREQWEPMCTQALDKRKLMTCLSQTELPIHLKYLYREAKSSMEENGINTLFVALGFLRWFEDKDKAKAHPKYAPLVLYPVDLQYQQRRGQYKLQLRDEEPQLNITLLEMLRQDFGLDLSALPAYMMTENGVDLKAIFTVLRGALTMCSGFSIVETAWLGLFSFRQFIMWSDLKRGQEHLMEHKVVRSLLSGYMDEAWTVTPGLFEEPETDNAAADQQHIVPLSADASQLAAICAAGKGESFVLHGPPGTGKSQTITNMIANALYQGKTVLFVAEKMAALSVVQARLAKLGLAPFCLELHSNKARKKDVLEQLSRTLELGHIAHSGGYEAKKLRNQQLKEELNQITHELHVKRNCGKSLYELIGVYEHYLEKKQGEVTISDLLLSQTTEQRYEAYRDALLGCIAAAKDCGGVQNHLFRLVQLRTYTAMTRDAMSVALKQFTAQLQPLEQYYETFRQRFALNISGTYGDVCQVCALAQRLQTIPSLPKTLLLHPNLPGIGGLLREIFEQGEHMLAERETLLLHFRQDVLDYDYQSAVQRLQKAEESFFLFRNARIQKLLDEINDMLYPGVEHYSKDDIPKVLVQLKRYHDLQEYIRLANPTVTVSLYGAAWKGVDSDFALLRRMYEEALGLHSLLAKFALTAEGKETAWNCLADIVESSDVYQAEMQTEADVYAVALAETQRQQEKLRMDYAIRMEAFHMKDHWFETVRTQIMLWRDHISELREWIGYLNAYDQAAKLGLSEVLESMMEGTVEPEHLVDTFYCQLSYGLIMRIIASSPVLSHFRGAALETTIEAFRRNDEELKQLLIQEMAATLSAKLPCISEGEASSEVGILKKAIRSGGRRLSIRRLFQEIPGLLQRISPCMLMSPISVAQYIDPSFPKFDLVIFDEASQLPTCDAVGAIARGENVVVVGDPKQLPPTSFFQTQLEEESFEEVSLESLLDDCMAVSMPQSHLTWHYRSRHESLIAYSNQMYYENRLHTFPSPREQERQVRWLPVEGYYDRGGTKQNRAEAEAVVVEIVRRLQADAVSKQSIGIVTFSLVQQRLIEDLFEETLLQQPQLCDRLDLLSEPIFFKNLENVQGDERDVILFSVGYGPDKNGKLSLNFGALNEAGGWRRLNVAITRARQEMMIFSTLRPEQMDLSKSDSEGLKGLKGFLEYAAYGRQLHAGAAMMPGFSRDDAARWILQLLKGAVFHGTQGTVALRYHTNVGCSDLKIDIAVVHPKYPQEYLMGFKLDGSAGAKVRSARDRYLLQDQVLEGLGWKLYHIWILDWLDQPEKELEKLRGVLEPLLAELETREQSRPSETEEAPLELEVEIPQPEALTLETLRPEAISPENVVLEEPEPKAEVIEPEKPVQEASPQEPILEATKREISIQDNGSQEQSTSKNLSEAPMQKESASEISKSEEPRLAMPEQEEPKQREPKPEATKPPVDGYAVLAQFERVTPETERLCTEYVETTFRKDYPQDSFYLEKTKPIIQRMLQKVLEQEAPISKRLLMKRVFQNFHIAKAGSKVVNTLEACMAEIPCQYRESFGQVFVWTVEQVPEQYMQYRIPRSAEARRSMEDIPLEEIACAIQDLLKQQIGMTQIDIIREVAKIFGYNRIGELMETQIVEATKLVIARGVAQISADGLRIQLSEEL